MHRLQGLSFWGVGLYGGVGEMPSPGHRFPPSSKRSCLLLGDSAQRRKLSGGRDLAPPRPRASSSFTFLSAESGSSCLSSMDDPDCDSTWEEESEEDGEDGQADDTTDEDTGDDDGDAEEARPSLFQVRRRRTGGR